MSDRPSKERIEQIRRGTMTGDIVLLLAEIDALRAERDVVRERERFFWEEAHALVSEMRQQEWTLGDVERAFREKANGNYLDVSLLSREEIDQLRADLPVAKEREKGCLYQHYKGGFYSLLLTARNEATKRRWAVYRDETGVWTRPLIEFEQKFTVVGGT